MVVAGHQLHRALRHVEGVLVPLQDALARREAGQQRILLAVLGDLDRRIADLELVAAPHLLAEGARQQLAAEAEAEQRLGLLVEAAQQIEHRRKGGEVHVVAGMLRPAEDDGRVVAVRRLRQRVAVVRQDGRQAARRRRPDGRRPGRPASAHCSE